MEQGEYVDQWDRVIEKGQQEASLLRVSHRIAQWKGKVMKCSMIKQWQRQKVWVLEQGTEQEGNRIKGQEGHQGSTVAQSQYEVRGSRKGHLQCMKICQGCALAVLSAGPQHLTFAARQPENLTFSHRNPILGSLDFTGLQRTGIALIFLRAQPCMLLVFIKWGLSRQLQ